jgi:hypothetical protein
MVRQLNLKNVADSNTFKVLLEHAHGDLNDQARRSPPRLDDLLIPLAIGPWWLA